jgi:NhaP-type Na+/H+ or K+/H+ antiporter
MSVVIVFSVFAHGMTAGPLARKYGAWVESTQPTQEVTPASEPAPRGRAFAHQHGQDHSLD